MVPLQVLLVKESVLSASDASFAGGVGLFRALAASLAAEPQQQQQHEQQQQQPPAGARGAGAAPAVVVAIATVARRGTVLAHAARHGLLAQLRPAAAAAAGADVVTWGGGDGDGGGGSGGGIGGGSDAVRVFVAIRPEIDGGSDADAAPARSPAALLLAAVEAAAAFLEQQQQQQQLEIGAAGLCVLDADATQRASVPAAGAAHGQPSHHQPQQQQQPFMAALLAVLQQPRSRRWRLLALVQNLAHTPFGPCGTAPRTRAVLEAWRGAAGVLCVSRFVRQYLEAHALPLLQQQQPGRPPPLLRVLPHPAALGACGGGGGRPHEDLGAAAAESLFGDGGSADEGGSSSQQQPQHGPAAAWRRPPVVAALKLTPEKGSALFFALAAALPELRFVGVTADPCGLDAGGGGGGGAAQQCAAAAGRVPGNVRLLPPAADVGEVLAGADAVVAPSVLHEAFGLVVADAQLRGVPTLVAAMGALPEAAGCCCVGSAGCGGGGGGGDGSSDGSGVLPPALPVSPVAFPLTQRRPAGRDDTGADAGAGAGAGAGVGDTAAALLEEAWLADERSWEGRVFAAPAREHVQAWAAALLAVLRSRRAYEVCSRAARAWALAAAGTTSDQEAQRAELRAWLQGVAAGASVCRDVPG